ncbi:MobA/MobL family protein [Sphingomonas aquatilis]|uniref:MobA/MobL family protein n=1 Tax=Sphingomonas aquatilis TaxID=93063 RepID=UPI0023F71FC1|nr:MobA/MobL family protein [Sphingomonas aquatilis]MCI4652603.1 MobA/MobL family protein [Sphingomonas aquatilis]
MNAITTLHARRVISIRPISAEGLRLFDRDRRATHATVTANYLYITRQAGHDALGRVDFRHRDDLVAHGLELPANHPRWAEEEGRIWREADAATADLAPDAVRARHVVVTLPETRHADEWIAMVRDYARTTIAAHGPAVAWAIHAKPDGAGGWSVPPHAHLLITTRVWRHDARHGATVPSWCGPAMQARLHADWLARLPDAMRVAAMTPYRAGAYTPAHPDCAALIDLFSGEPSRHVPASKRGIRRRPSRRIRTMRTPSSSPSPNRPGA